MIIVRRDVLDVDAIENFMTGSMITKNVLIRTLNFSGSRGEGFRVFLESDFDMNCRKPKSYLEPISIATLCKRFFCISNFCV